MYNSKKIIIWIFFSVLSFFVIHPVFASSSAVDALYNNIETKYQQLPIQSQKTKWVEIRKTLVLIKNRYQKQSFKNFIDLLIKKIDVKISSFDNNISWNVDNMSYLEGIREDLLLLVNIERQKVWLGKMILNDLLNQAAQMHSEYMFKTNDFEHITRDGRSPLDRVRAVWYTWSYVWENIAWNQRSTWEVMKDWMDSPWHKENILRDNFNEIGIWFSGYYWVQNFGWY